MNSNLSELKEAYDLKMESPFTIEINGVNHTFTCLIKGYGAEKGMVVEKEWKRIKEVSDELVHLGYGYSCFDLESPSCKEGFGEVLTDWGKQEVYPDATGQRR